MSIHKKIIITVAAGLALGVSSCRKFLDVNTNPNQVTSATVQTLLPAGQLYVASALGVDLEINGSMWAGYWTQNPNSSQYRSIEQYAPTQDGFSTPWQNLYSANENFFQMGKLADSLKRKHYKAISLLMRAYTFQLITDGWGDAPYSQALKAQLADGGILNPKYDSQVSIYNGLIFYIDSAEALLNTAEPTSNEPGTDDLIFNGNITRWKKFGYTLALKMYMRFSEKNPVWAQAGIARINAIPGVQYLGSGDDAKISFGFNNTNNKNPLDAEMTSTTLNGTQNLVGSATCIDSMNSNADYREYLFYSQVTADVFTGLTQGHYDAVIATSSVSVPNVYVGGNVVTKALAAKSANAPVNLLMGSESYFLQAEAVARGWAAGDDSALFYQGIKANFDYYSSAFTDLNDVWASAGQTSASGATLSSDIVLNSDFAYYSYVNGDTVYNTPAGTPAPAYWSIYSRNYTLTAKLRKIITQKWFGMCGNQGFEAWTEFRRTGYPDFFVHSVNSLIGNQLPVRFLYPSTESTRNTAFPGLQLITTKMWWDL